MIISHKNSVVLIIGASSGIGYKLAEAFYSEGARVIATYHSHSELLPIRAENDHWLVRRCDITDEDSLSNLCHEVVRYFHTIDVAINCAGILEDSSLAEMGYETWQKVLDVNLTGSYIFIKNTAAVMRGNKKGKIILLSSIWGHNGRKSQANYSASKAGLQALMKVAAKEFASDNIQINAVCPGFIQTNLNKDCVKKLKAAEEESYLPINNNINDLIHFLLFFCTDKVLSVTGQCFIIDSRIM
jgi:3-oxoacyl-[acyl-carrier protein] reductase